MQTSMSAEGSGESEGVGDGAADERASRNETGGTLRRVRDCMTVQ